MDGKAGKVHQKFTGLNWMPVSSSSFILYLLFLQESKGWCGRQMRQMKQQTASMSGPGKMTALIFETTWGFKSHELNFGPQKFPQFPGNFRQFRRMGMGLKRSLLTVWEDVQKQHVHLYWTSFLLSLVIPFKETFLVGSPNGLAIFGLSTSSCRSTLGWWSHGRLVAAACTGFFRGQDSLSRDKRCVSRLLQYLQVW